jgi:hypothetical protein
MNRRTRVLVILVGVALGAFVLDSLFKSLWWEPWKKAGEDLREADLAIARLQTALKREDKVAKDWEKVKKLLDKPRVPDVENHFKEQLAAICAKAGVENNMASSTVGHQGDFKEYVVDTKLKLTWSQYVDVLGELYSSRELLKPIRITLNSKYDREDRIDADLKLSTIEFDPVLPKAGIK